MKAIAECINDYCQAEYKYQGINNKTTFFEYADQIAAERKAGVCYATAKEMFLSKHQELFNKDKKWFFSLFSGFRKTEVNKDWSIEQIFAHSGKFNNRSRKICIQLGWMRSNGTLTEGGFAVMRQETESGLQDSKRAVPAT